MPVTTDILPSTPVPKTDWNNYVASTNAIGGDVSNPAYLAGHIKDNPDSKLKPEHIPAAQQEIAALKNGQPISGMTPEQAQYIQKGLTNNYKNNPNNLNYPVSPVHGTDLDKHLEANKANIPVGDPNRIPAPNYNDPASRLAYAQQFTKKYGPLMSGRGDTPLRINEKPENGTDTAKNIATKAASKFGLDPALLYSSAMEEGMSGLFPDKKGEVNDSGDKDFPTQGSASFGLDNFVKDFPGLVKKGLLPADFANRFKAAPSPDPNETQNSANYRTPDDAIMAKAAIVKNYQDQTEDFAKKKGITLSPKAKEFFTLAAYNAGASNMQKMMAEYNQKGALKSDDFINKPETGGYKTIHQNVSRRILMRDGLRREGLF